jgi:large subunit ribosomal protein L19
MINATISAIEKAQLRSDIPNFRVGDTVRVHYKIVEGDKERIQVFQGVVIKRHRAGARSTFTVRKISSNIGVERVFLEHSPRVDKIDILSRGVVRRARLFFLRDLSGKAARLKDERDKLPRKALPHGETVYPAGFPAYAASRRSAQPRARAKAARSAG